MTSAQAAQVRAFTSNLEPGDSVVGLLVDKYGNVLIRRRHSRGEDGTIVFSTGAHKWLGSGPMVGSAHERWRPLVVDAEWWRGECVIRDMFREGRRRVGGVQHLTETANQPAPGSGAKSPRG